MTNGRSWVGATGTTPPDDWTASGDGTYTVTPEGWLRILRVSSATTTTYEFDTVIGGVYSYQLDIKDAVSGTLRVETRDSSNVTVTTDDYTATADDIYRTFTATSTTSKLRVRNIGTGDSEFAIDNVFIYKV